MTMASIQSAALAITLLGPNSSDPKRTNARLVATCKVVFDHIEDCMMRACPDGIWFALEARCFGEDHPLDHARDTQLFFIQKREFPGTDPSSVTFTMDTLADAFNEDRGPSLPETLTFPLTPLGRDEIYVRLTLFNLFSNTVVAEAETNLVMGFFG
jgi:hypothetical protein